MLPRGSTFSAVTFSTWSLGFFAFNYRLAGVYVKCMGFGTSRFQGFGVWCLVLGGFACSLFIFLGFWTQGWFLSFLVFKFFVFRA